MFRSKLKSTRLATSLFSRRMARLKECELWLGCFLPHSISSSFIVAGQQKHTLFIYNGRAAQTPFYSFIVIEYTYLDSKAN